MTEEQKAALHSFVRTTARLRGHPQPSITFMGWPEVRENAGGLLRRAPLMTFDAPMWWRTQLSPRMSHLPPSFTLRDGIYQLKKLLPREVRVLMRWRNKLTTPSARAPARPGFRRGLGAYERQRTGLLLHAGHVEELWEPPDLQRCSAGPYAGVGWRRGGRDSRVRSE